MTNKNKNRKTRLLLQSFKSSHLAHTSSRTIFNMCVCRNNINATMWFQAIPFVYSVRLITLFCYKKHRVLSLQSSLTILIPCNSNCLSYILISFSLYCPISCLFHPRSFIFFLQNIFCNKIIEHFVKIDRPNRTIFSW